MTRGFLKFSALGLLGILLLGTGASVEAEARDRHRRDEGMRWRDREWRHDRYDRHDRHDRREWRRERRRDRRDWNRGWNDVGYGFGVGLMLGMPMNYGYGYDYGYDDGVYGDPYVQPYREVVREVVVAGDGVSCAAGARLLRNKGYASVTVRTCNSRIYQYAARSPRRGAVVVRMNSATGGIMSVRAR